MAATITATVSGASSNAYAELADAILYFDERVREDDWTAASTDVRNRALISATRRLDHERYQGEKATSGQALSWPRIGATNFDGLEYETDAIPTIVIHAMYELALRFIVDDAGATDPQADSGLEPFHKAAVGPLNVEMDKAFSAGQLPENVMGLLRPVRRSRLSAMLLRA